MQDSIEKTKVEFEHPFYFQLQTNKSYFLRYNHYDDDDVKFPVLPSKYININNNKQTTPPNPLCCYINNSKHANKYR